ncbi:MAG TPA: iron-sulfur cluster assembly protein, partial [Acidisoma sp.]|nr:iron-sulfur cluster assembly protein [Acidisoma sp.]
MADNDEAIAAAARRLIASFQAEDPQGELLGGSKLEGIAVRDGLVQVTLSVDRTRAGALEQARKAAEAALARLPGVKNATVVLTA